MKTMRNECLNENWVDVSHGLGIPFGGIGTGYCVFGKYGFSKVNFDSTPDPETMQYNGRGPREACNYLEPPENLAPFALFLSEGQKEYAMQETPVAWRPGAQPVAKTTAHAFLPRGHFTFTSPGWDLNVSMTGFSPMIPHDLANSTIPVQVHTLSLTNTARQDRTLTLKLIHRERLKTVGKKAVFEEPAGQAAFLLEGGLADASGVQKELSLKGGESKTVRLFIAWYYPSFVTPSTTLTETYTRYYSKTFSSAAGVIDAAVQNADRWSQAVDEWHDSFDVPAYFKRLWFSSLCSTICSTMLSDDPYFFEIETPHRHVCTMDVDVYCHWLYMVNWPEIERMEMNQYFRSIPTTGERTGLVWHSLWDDAAHYVEEPIFLTRVYRDFLWFRDRDWLSKTFDLVVLAANRVYEEGHSEHLIDSPHGNQSYDAWKMPGVSAFVNSAWVYGLYALERMAAILQRPAKIDGTDVSELRTKAAADFDRLLWNETSGCWNCFHRTPGAAEDSVPESVFTDQLFGYWALSLDSGARAVLPADKIRTALQTLYTHNCIDDPAGDFRGWVNGLLPGRRADQEPTGYHARVFWICAQLDLGSLLGLIGREEEALDVFQSLERSLHNNHLAVGEWNQSIDAGLNTRSLPEEPGKDTPRFPPYPRYKCAWEYLIRLLGLQADETSLYLQPFRSLDFSLHNVQLAGVTLTVEVQAGWRKATVNGKDVSLPLHLPRDGGPYCVRFEK